MPDGTRVTKVVEGDDGEKDIEIVSEDPLDEKDKSTSTTTTETPPSSTVTKKVTVVRKITTIMPDGTSVTKIVEGDAVGDSDSVDEEVLEGDKEWISTSLTGTETTEIPPSSPIAKKSTIVRKVTTVMPDGSKVTRIVEVDGEDATSTEEILAESKFSECTSSFTTETIPSSTTTKTTTVTRRITTTMPDGTKISQILEGDGEFDIESQTGIEAEAPSFTSTGKVSVVTMVRTLPDGTVVTKVVESGKDDSIDERVSDQSESSAESVIKLEMLSSSEESKTAKMSESDEIRTEKTLEEQDESGSETKVVHSEIPKDDKSSTGLTASESSKVMEEKEGESTSSQQSRTEFNVEEWGKPMGLPSPPDDEPITERRVMATFGRPLGLPTPPEPTEVDNKTKISSRHTSALKSKGKRSSSLTRPTKSSEDKRSDRSNIDNISSPSRSVTSSPKHSKVSSKKSLGEDVNPVYVDLTYVPHHADPLYGNVDFFRRVRARYYVFSGTNPSKEVLNALLKAKQTWEDKDAEVTIIPTYETDTLGYWIALNQDILAENKIDVAPSASRCTINLQDHETSCAAYRLEF